MANGVCGGLFRGERVGDFATQGIYFHETDGSRMSVVGRMVEGLKTLYTSIGGGHSASTEDEKGHVGECCTARLDAKAPQAIINE